MTTSATAGLDDTAAQRPELRQRSRGFHCDAHVLELFRDDPEHLSAVVRFDRQRPGSVEGIDVVHRRPDPAHRHDTTRWEEVGRAHRELFGDIMPVTAMSVAPP